MDFIKSVLTLTHKQAKILLKHITDSQLSILGELCYNLVYGKLDPVLIVKLKRYRSVIIRLSDKRISNRKRRLAVRTNATSVLKILNLTRELLP